MLEAEHLSKALKDVNTRTNYKNMIEIMVTYTESAEKHLNFTNAYKERFGHPLEDDLKHHLRSDFENVLLEMAARVRKPKQPTDEKKVEETAKQLNDEVGKWRDKRQVFDATLLETPFEQLDVIFFKFKEIHDGKELEEVVKNKTIQAKRNAYQDLITHQYFVEYFSTRLKESVDGPGTDEQTLIRVILIHSETDLKEIKDEFQKSYNRDLAEKIGRDTSGSFEGLLRRYISGNVDQQNQVNQSLPSKNQQPYETQNRQS